MARGDGLKAKQLRPLAEPAVGPVAGAGAGAAQTVAAKVRRLHMDSLRPPPPLNGPAVSRLGLAASDGADGSRTAAATTLTRGLTSRPGSDPGDPTDRSPSAVALSAR